MTSFEVIIDDTLYNLTTQGNDKDNILSAINDFQDGDWWYEKFNDYIFDNIVLTALSAAERAKIPNSSFSQMKKACRNLRLSTSDKDNGRGSEIAEILLYAFMKEHYNALPVIPKIFDKQNPKMYAFGADGVHIVLDEDDFSIWYGEAKFYEKIDLPQLKKIANSVHNSLETAKIRKENSLVTDLRDLEELLKDDSRKDNILLLLDDKTSIDKLKPHLHIPIMILYECELTAKQHELTDDYKNGLKSIQMENAKSYFTIQDELCKDRIFKYSDITFHLIYFPVPNKDKVVNNFTSYAEVLRKSV